MKQACKYNVIRFQPYDDTEEFANIGVILYAPTTGEFVFKLLPQNTYGRITSFFSKLDKKILQDTLKLLSGELGRVQKMPLDFKDFDLLYNELVRPREGMIQHSEHSVQFTENPAETVNELFQHYVHHSFTEKAGHEERMRASITQLLNTHDLAGRFKRASLGSDYYEVALPFVHKNVANPAVIKPIHFKHADSTKLFDHGLQWLTKMDQLFRMKVTTADNVLFTYKAPAHQEGKIYDAYEKVSEQIRESGITMLDIESKAAIAEFARQHLRQCFCI